MLVNWILYGQLISMAYAIKPTAEGLVTAFVAHANVDFIVVPIIRLWRSIVDMQVWIISGLLYYIKEVTVLYMWRTFIVLSLLYPFPSTYIHFSISIYQAPAAQDDDDLDLFGDETEEDKKAAEEREAAKKSAKKKESKLNLFYLWFA